MKILFFVHVNDKQYLRKVPIILFCKTLPAPPTLPKSCKSNKTNVNKSQFLVHRGCNSAMSLQHLRSVFCMCFADIHEHKTQSQCLCTASQVRKKKQNQEPTPKPQAGAGRPLPSLLRAVPEAGWFGRERNTKVCALHTHPPTWLPSSSPFPCLFAQRRRLFPVTSPPALQRLPLRIPRSQNAPPGREMLQAGGGRLGERRHPLCPAGHLPKVISGTSISLPSFPPFLPSRGERGS